MSASISVLCYKYKTLSNGQHPLMLRVHKDGKRKLVSLGVSVSASDWDFTKNQPFDLEMKNNSEIYKQLSKTGSR